jgi:hypothetical protein
VTESLREALDRLAAAGYRDDFRATSSGLGARLAGTVFSPESMVIEEFVRFEGESDPGEEAIVFALRSEADGTRGTYTVAYGPGMDLLDVGIVERLRTKKP